MLVGKHMTEDPHWINKAATVGEAAIALDKAHVRHLPVLSDGVVVGIVSDRDLRSVAPQVDELRNDPSGLMERLGAPVTELMSSEVASVTPERDLQNAIDLLLEKGVGALPVVDPGSGRLVGMLSYVDALRALRDLAWG